MSVTVESDGTYDIQARADADDSPPSAPMPVEETLDPTAGASEGRIIPVTERRTEGRALRQQCPRSSHARFVVDASSRDVIELIRASNEGRLENLIPLRHSRMLESPFAFFRGSAVLQAQDLAATPRAGIQVQACGDCHLLNFGGFATPERNMAFDLNDFDETFLAPWEWDVKRLSVSMVLAARWRGFSDVQARQAARGTVASYRDAMHGYAEMSTMDVWYSRIGSQEFRNRVRGNPKLAKRTDANLRHAQQQTSERVLHKLAEETDGRLRIRDQPPLLYHPVSYDITQVAERFLADYAETLREDHRSLLRRFQFVDAALKVVGVGSVGTRCFIVLLQDELGAPMFLQVKEARRSVLEAYTGAAAPSPAPHQGQRVVAGQRLMQAVSDIYLGWATGPGQRDYYVRQLRDMKASAQLEAMDPAGLAVYGQLCGETLARAHAKAGQAAPISGYLGKSAAFDDAVEKYATVYADQVERDHETFRVAVRNGLLPSETSSSAIETMIS